MDALAAFAHLSRLRGVKILQLIPWQVSSVLADRRGGGARRSCAAEIKVVP